MLRYLLKAWQWLCSCCSVREMGYRIYKFMINLYYEKFADIYHKEDTITMVKIMQCFIKITFIKENIYPEILSGNFCNHSYILFWNHTVLNLNFNKWTIPERFGWHVSTGLQLKKKKKKNRDWPERLSALLSQLHASWSSFTSACLWHCHLLNYRGSLQARAACDTTEHHYNQILKLARCCLYNSWNSSLESE